MYILCDEKIEYCSRINYVELRYLPVSVLPQYYYGFFYSNFQYEKKLIKAGRHMVPTINILNFRNFIFQLKYIIRKCILCIPICVTQMDA